MTRREAAAVLAGPTLLAASSWVISHGWFLLTAIAVGILLVAFLRLTAGPVRPAGVSRSSSLPRPMRSPRSSDGSGHGPVHTRVRHGMAPRVSVPES